MTGRTGFIGSHLETRLLKDGHEVFGIDRKNWDGSTGDLIGIFNWFNPELVFHLGAKFVCEHTSEDIDDLVTSNVLFSTQVFEAMKEVGCTRLVMTGTCWQNYDCREYRPVNLYAATKEAVESILEYYIDAHGFKAVVLRLGDTYGPKDFRGKLFNVLNKASEENPLKMSLGEQVLNLVHVNDVVEALLKSGKRTEYIKGKEVFFLSGSIVMVKDLVTVYEFVKGKKVPVIFGAKPYRKREVFFPFIGETLPGWKAKIGLQEGIKSLWS